MSRWSRRRGVLRGGGAAGQKPAFVIGDVADELNVDVIVMGTRGVNLGSDRESTAARVIQLAPPCAGGAVSTSGTQATSPRPSSSSSATWTRWTW